VEKEAVVGCTATADRSVSTQCVADSKESAEGLYTVDVKITNRTRRDRDELTRFVSRRPRISLSGIVPRTEGYTCDAKVQAVSLVEWRMPHQDSTRWIGCAHHGLGVTLEAARGSLPPGPRQYLARPFPPTLSSDSANYTSLYTTRRGACGFI
jgi:hypothetical protein